jgi:hypothetical protein
MGERHGRTGSPGDEAPAPASPPMHRLEGFASATRYKRVQAGPSGSKRVQAGPSGSKRELLHTFRSLAKPMPRRCRTSVTVIPPSPARGWAFFVILWFR